jgi:6-pyruvoyltetrahydropterin/6-carboxytetrahydropterin synthase
MKIYLKRKFDAAHKLCNILKTPQENIEIYGKCTSLHGHTWVVEVEIYGNVDSDTGMVVNFNEIKSVIDSFDHGFVNDLLKVPTAENLVSYLLEKFTGMSRFNGVRVRVYESENAYAEDEWFSK